MWLVERASASDAGLMRQAPWRPCRSAPTSTPCIGNHFARVEAVLLLAMIAHQFEFRLLAAKPIAYELASTLRPQFVIGWPNSKL